MGQFTICWDCRFAVGGCSWSSKFKPIEGWTAYEVKPSNTKPYSTYMVEQCPKFERDAYDGGTRREKREIILDK